MLRHPLQAALLKSAGMFAFLTALLSTHALAQSNPEFVVRSVDSDSELTLAPINTVALPPEWYNDRYYLIFWNDKHDAILGVGKITESLPPTGQPENAATAPTAPVPGENIPPVATVIKVKLKLHSQYGLIRIGLIGTLIDLRDENLKLPGHVTVLVTKDKRAQNRYKKLITQGGFSGQTAATLERREWIAGPFLAGYGIFDRLMAFTIPYLGAVKSPNLGLKWLFFSTPENELSVLGSATYQIPFRSTYETYQLFWDSRSNSTRFTSYTRLSVTSKVAEGSEGTQSYSARRFTADLQVNYGYQLGNWNRLLVGPRINFEQQTAGGTIAYLFLGKRFDFTIGAFANDFFGRGFNLKGYTPYLDFWWRF